MLLARTWLSIVSALVALVVPTAVVLVAGLDSVAQVDDGGTIQRGLPLPALPVLNVTAGARTRWAAILSGVWMIVILLAFSGAVGKVAMPTLAAILVYAAVGSLRPKEIATILRTGPNAQIAFVVTLIATLVLPVAAAVGIGVALSLLLQLNQEAIDLKVVEKVVELAHDAGGRVVEQPAPATLTSHTAIVLDVYGSLFYAGVRTLQARLPDPGDTEGAEVVLRLRGRTTLGATFFTVISGYADRAGLPRRPPLPGRPRSRARRQAQHW